MQNQTEAAVASSKRASAAMYSNIASKLIRSDQKYNEPALASSAALPVSSVSSMTRFSDGILAKSRSESPNRAHVHGALRPCETAPCSAASRAPRAILLRQSSQHTCLTMPKVLRHQSRVRPPVPTLPYARTTPNTKSREFAMFSYNVDEENAEVLALVSKTDPGQQAPSRGGEDDDQVLHRIQQRRKQIAFGKNTLGYMRYISEIPLDERRNHHPRTPDPIADIPKRRFDGLVKAWRRSLHEWEPPQTQTSTAPAAAQAAEHADGAAAAEASEADLDALLLLGEPAVPVDAGDLQALDAELDAELAAMN